MTFVMCNETRSMSQKQIVLSVNSSTIPVIADEFEIQHMPYRRTYRLVSTNEHFQKIFGNSSMIVALSPTSAQFPKKESVSEREHIELQEAVYQALTEELAHSI